MKQYPIKSTNDICGLLEEIKYEYSLGISTIDGIDDAIEYLEKLEKQPEPLDPHTCDLMVGDVVEATFDEDGINKLIVVEDMRGGTFNFWNYTERYFMCLPDSAINKLTHRNGATIKEVGND